MLRDRAGHVAVTLALAAIPLVFATGAGIDYARGLVVRSNMADALDAAGLAVGKQTSKPANCPGTTSAERTACTNMQAIAQLFFNANYKQDTYGGVGTIPTVGITIVNQSVTLTATDNVPTTFLAVADRMVNSTALDNMAIGASSTVVWGQTKLWVALVLDNSGSMSNNGKMTALKSASQSLLTTLQGASQTAGDVEVGIIPFTNDVNQGTSTTTATWLDWSQWATKTWGSETAETPDANHGPGDDCPYSYGCRKPGSNETVTVSTIDSSGGTKGYICPEGWNSQSDGSNGHIFMGCWKSVATGNTATVYSGSSTSKSCSSLGYSSSNCSCNTTTSHGNSTRTCTTKTWTHTTWVPETSKSLWLGCVTDRDKTSSYDIKNTQPSGAAAYPAENNQNCPGAAVSKLGYNWTNLSSAITAMQPAGSTNQAIGIAHGWQMVTPGDPYSTPTLPGNTTRYIILLSDGLNTQDRWWGNGSTENTANDQNIDDRETAACAAAKLDGVVIYSLYVNINNSDGNSAPLSTCASDSSKYFVVTQSSDIATAFTAIGQQITNLRVAQ
jgi:Flp pilus assembly protein TadG